MTLFFRQCYNQTRIMKNINYKIIISLMFITLMATPCWAVSLISQDISKRAIELYEQGAYGKAVHEFSKALLADPNNQEALMYLNKMGLEGGIYSQGATPQAAIGGMVADIQDYQRSVSDLQHQVSMEQENALALEKDKDALQGVVARQETEKKALIGEIDNVNEELKGREDQIEDLNRSLKDKGGEIVRLHTNLYDIKGRLVSQRNLAKEKTKALKEQERDFVLAQKDWKARSRREKLAYEDKLAVIERAHVLQKTAVLDAETQKHKIVRELQDTVHEIRRGKELTQEQLDLTLQDLGFLKKKAARKERRINDLEASIKILEDELDSAQRRIHKLYAQNTEYQEIDRQSSVNLRWLKRKDSVISSLKQELLACRQNILLYRDSPEEEKGARLNDLKDQLMATKKELFITQTLLEEKVSENDILKERLADTQEQLGLVEGLLDEKDSELEDLEGQLTDVLGLPE